MITVGITGHRFLAEVEKITPAVHRVLDEVESAFGHPPLRIVSSLAEGADMLVVQQALKRGNPSLVAALPFPRDEYLSDFQSSSAQKVFIHLLDQAEEIITLPPTPTKEKSYQAAGLYMLEQADILIAIWDGQDSQGTGGTGEIVAEARRLGLPLAWIHAGNRLPGSSQPTTLGKEQGTITFERFPD